MTLPIHVKIQILTEVATDVARVDSKVPRSPAADDYRLKIAREVEDMRAEGIEVDIPEI